MTILKIGLLLFLHLKENKNIAIRISITNMIFNKNSEVSSSMLITPFAKIHIEIM